MHRARAHIFCQQNQQQSDTILRLCSILQAFIHRKNHSLSILCQERCNDAMNKAFHIFDLFSNGISHRVHHSIHVEYSTFIRFHFFQIFNSQSAHFQWRQTKLIFVSAEHYIIHSQSQSQLHTNIHSLVHRFILCGLFSFFSVCLFGDVAYVGCCCCCWRFQWMHAIH